MALIRRNVSRISVEGGVMSVSFSYDSVTLLITDLVLENSCPFSGKLKVHRKLENIDNFVDLMPMVNRTVDVTLFQTYVTKNIDGSIIFPFGVNLRRS